MLVASYLELPYQPHRYRVRVAQLPKILSFYPSVHDNFLAHVPFQHYLVVRLGVQVAGFPRSIAKERQLSQVPGTHL